MVLKIHSKAILDLIVLKILFKDTLQQDKDIIIVIVALDIVGKCRTVEHNMFNMH